MKKSFFIAGVVFASIAALLLAAVIDAVITNAKIQALKEKYTEISNCEVWNTAYNECASEELTKMYKKDHGYGGFM
ncbi:MAG TPA: hypothetical protein VF220_05385 [Nitrososphaeraceae archaeon]